MSVTATTIVSTASFPISAVSSSNARRAILTSEWLDSVPVGRRNRRSHIQKESGMSTEGQASQLDHSEDESILHRLGYAQELFRAMGGFRNFAISFTIISILAG